ncbi:ABC transporter permease [Pseudomonas sp. TH10]|uniref:ABC transporter permease n=1 Tax=Pseudomonas sp. TH10 TaxID=2796376 RepID=UPI0019119BD4|nr:ABC transporter permease [Pseudomonas sp. TH10]MBK5518180.1 ABC transporter permease [Pseudomonas sp. TH10]
MSQLLSSETWQRLRHNHALQAGLFLLILLLLAGFLGPLLLNSDPLEVDFSIALLPPGAEHWFGTDDLGRDVFSRVVHAIGIDMQIASICVILPFLIGTTVGLLSGYLGGWVDTVLMRLVDILWAFPFYVLVIAIVGSLGPSVGNMYIAFTVVVWISFARIVRGEVLLVKRAEYVQAAQVLGYSHLRIVLRHVLPNVITPAIVFMMADVVLTILAVTSLGFLGLGIQPPTPEWGVMISEGRNFILDGWWISLFPGLAIVYVGISFALLGDGLDNFMRPKA